jgi:hypothetical protein
MYRHLSLSCQVTHKSLKEDLKKYTSPRWAKSQTDASCYYNPAAPFPKEYPRGCDIRVLLPGVGQLRKMSIGGQLTSSGGISRSPVSE